MKNTLDVFIFSLYGVKLSRVFIKGERNKYNFFLNFM